VFAEMGVAVKEDGTILNAESISERFKRLDRNFINYNFM